jgi:hypothetical protein
MPKTAQPFPLYKASGKSAAPTRSILEPPRKQPDKVNTVATTTLVPNRQILLDLKDGEKKTHYYIQVHSTPTMSRALPSHIPPQLPLFHPTVSILREETTPLSAHFYHLSF